MPNLTKSNYSKMSIDESFKAYKKDDVKAIYDIKLNSKKKFQERRIISKILKLDENNQYGFAMTKSIPTRCIKEKPLPTWITFNLLIETVSLDGPMGHLSVADIIFDHENATEKQVLYNDILPPVIEKHKTLDANEKSIYQLLEQYHKTDNSAQKACSCTKKSQATLFPKKIIPLYLEELKFLIQRCGWLVTKIYSHFTFEQDAFKKDFVLHNQKEQKNVKRYIDKDFYNLMNNANF